MSVLSDILDNLHTLLVEYSGAPADKLIIRDQAAPRPTPPYITYGWNSPATTTGVDAQGMYVEGGESVTRITGTREGTMDFEGYGEQTSDWLESLRLAMADRQFIRRVAAAANVNLYPDSDVQDVTRLLQSSLERRYIMTIGVGYAVRLDRPVVDALTMNINLNIESPTHDDDLVLDEDIDLSLNP